jgi:putative NADH-flavin reductase
LQAAESRLCRCSPRGLKESVLLRSPGKAALPIGVKVFKGDLLDIATLGLALQGQDTVLSAVGTKLSRKPTTQLSDGARNLVSAMEHVGPKRLIAITGIGAGDSRGHGSFLYNHAVLPILLNEIYKDKTRQEDVIRASSLDWTIVRPAELTNGAGGAKLRVATDLRGFYGTKIARADVAAFMLDQLGSSAFIRAAPSISN